VTGPLRTAWDVAALESLGTSVAALDAMVRAGALDLTAFLATVTKGSGRWNVAKVRRAAVLVDPRAASPPESRVRVALAMAGLHLVPQCEVRIGDQVVRHADLGDPELRIAVEYEGEYHFTGAKIDSDDERYAAFEAAGWIVVRLSVYDLRDLEGVVTQVRAAIESRR
jgi:very-short-patch-repair endonuclease